MSGISIRGRSLSIAIGEDSRQFVDEIQQAVTVTASQSSRPSSITSAAAPEMSG
jgi:hypothetical protein